MKKRILSIICAVAILASLLTVGIVSTSAAGTISGAFDASMWVDEGGKIDSEGRLTLSSNKYSTITTANKYNLGTTWEAEIYVNYASSNNAASEPVILNVGQLSAVIYNCTYDKSSTTVTTNGKVELVQGESTVLGSFDLGSTFGTPDITATKMRGTLKLAYNDGTATVSIAGSPVITKSVSGLDFSNVAITVSAKNNWVSNNYLTSFSLTPATVVGGTSSAPESSEAPASSAPESSEAPASSAPESSEAPASSAPESSEAPTSSEAPVAEKLTTPISGALVAEDWDPADKIVDGAFSTGANANVITVTSVKKYDLGTEWVASMKLETGAYMGNNSGQPSKLIIGDVEAIIYNAVDNGANPYVALNVKGAEVGKYELDASYSVKNNGHSGVLELSYKAGAIEVSCDGQVVIQYNASNDNLDFGSVNFGLSLKGNWVANEDKFSITEFAIETADCVPEPGDPIVTVSDAVFSATDWTGDTAAITTEGQFQATGNSKRKITSIVSYNLSEGFKFAGELTFKNGYTNYYGEHASMLVGSAEDGIEIRIKNVQGQGMYTGHLVVKGEEVASVDLLNAPNGKWEMVYKNGKLTVNLDSTPVTWTLANKSTATSVAIDGVDFSNKNLSFYIAGNYDSRRYWTSYSLSPVAGGSGGTGGSTGDARNLIIPAVALVFSACAVAFVAKNRKVAA